MMPTKEIILSQGKFTSYRKLVNEEKGFSGYEFLHEDRCNGSIISILPFRRNDTMIRRDNPFDFLLRSELTPCWDENENVWSSITGGVDNGNNEIETALIELEEEAGYKVNAEDLIFLGYSFGTKSSDTIYTLFSVDLTDYERGVAKGDGSLLEGEAYCEWVEDISIAYDPLVYSSYFKLKSYGVF